MAGNDRNQGTHGLLAGAADWLDSWAPIKLLRVFEVFAILIAIVAFWLELDQRRTDRAVRIATLYAQIAQLHALPDGQGLSSLKPSVEILADEDIPMVGINLSGAELVAADLASADLALANLSEAVLYGANLRGAFLAEADLSGADLSKADLTAATLTLADLTNAALGGTVLRYADVSGATLLGYGLTQSQLDAACAETYAPPTVPSGLTWRNGPCPQPTTNDFTGLPLTP